MKSILNNKSYWIIPIVLVSTITQNGFGMFYLTDQQKRHAVRRLEQRAEQKNAQIIVVKISKGSSSGELFKQIRGGWIIGKNTAQQLTKVNILAHNAGLDSTWKGPNDLIYLRLRQAHFQITQATSDDEKLKIATQTVKDLKKASSVVDQCTKEITEIINGRIDLKAVTDYCHLHDS